MEAGHRRGLEFMIDGEISTMAGIDAPSLLTPLETPLTEKNEGKRATRRGKSHTKSTQSPGVFSLSRSNLDKTVT